MKALAIIKNALFYFSAATGIFKTISALYRSEIAYRKRLFVKSFISLTLAASFFLGFVLSLGYLAFLILEKFMDDPILSTLALNLSFLILGSLFLLIGNRFLSRLFSIDRKDENGR